MEAPRIKAGRGAVCTARLAIPSAITMPARCASEEAHMDRMTAVVHQSGAQRHAGLPESGRCMAGEVQKSRKARMPSRTRWHDGQSRKSKPARPRGGKQAPARAVAAGATAGWPPQPLRRLASKPCRVRGCSPRLKASISISACCGLRYADGAGLAGPLWTDWVDWRCAKAQGGRAPCAANPDRAPWPRW